eukprot:jgi/Chlat1/5616/Chrsp369S05377
MVEEAGEQKKKEKRRVSALDMPDVLKGSLPPHLEKARTRAIMGKHAPVHTSTMQYSGSYMSVGVDNSVALETIKDRLRIDIEKLTHEEMVFDLVGIDPAIANAIRRILISEVPTMAIEKVFMADNTSIVQDEVLAHRLGMTPVKADPRRFVEFTDNDTANEHNTIVFSLKAECRREGDDIKGARVLSGDIRWLPQGSELPEDSDQKFTSFSGKMAEELQIRCPMHVFDIEEGPNGQKTAVAARPRSCTLCRECVRPEGWDKMIELRRVKDHFIFSIESTGALPASVLFTEAIQVLQDKCAKLLAELS